MIETEGIPYSSRSYDPFVSLSTPEAVPQNQKQPEPRTNRHEPVRSGFGPLRFTRSHQIVTIEVHHLIPGGDEVMDKLFLPVRAPIDLGQRPKLSIGTEDQVDPCAGPLHRARLAISPFKHVLSARNRLPLRPHIQQIEEEVVGQRSRLRGQYAMFCAVAVGP